MTVKRRIVIVDDHPMVREGLKGRLSLEPDLEVCGEAEEVVSAVQLIEQAAPDLAVVDVSLGSGSGIDLIRRLRARDCQVPVLMLSMYEENLYADRALRAGAMGYVSKNASSKTIIDAVRHVLSGRMYLSPEYSELLAHRIALGREGLSDDPVTALSDRELEVFRLIGSGRTTAELASELHLSIHTVDTHRQRIKSKPELQSAAALSCAAAQWVLENG